MTLPISWPGVLLYLLVRLSKTIGEVEDWASCQAQHRQLAWRKVCHWTITFILRAPTDYSLPQLSLSLTQPNQINN